MGNYEICFNCGNTTDGDSIYKCDKCGQIYCPSCKSKTRFGTTLCPICESPYKTKLGEISNKKRYKKDDDDDKSNADNDREYSTHKDYGNDNSGCGIIVLIIIVGIVIGGYSLYKKIFVKDHNNPTTQLSLDTSFGATFVNSVSVGSIFVFENNLDFSPKTSDEIPAGQEQFSNSSDNYIYFNLNLIFPKTNNRIDFTIDFVVLDNNTNATVFTGSNRFHVDQEWTNSNHYSHIGNSLKTWREGNYRIELSAYGKSLGKQTFSIVEHSTSATVTDYDGNTYKVVTIGNQVWMAENLKVTHYNDGTEIPNVTNDNAWVNLTSGAYCWYNNDKDTYGNTYGALYNWHAVNTGKLAPNGWHVPNDDEWKTLEIYLGIAENEINITGRPRGTDEGSKLAGNSSLWENRSFKVNGNFGISGFAGVPGGFRAGMDGIFGYIGTIGNWWSMTECNANMSIDRSISSHDSGKIGKFWADKRNGYSIRCIKD